MPQGGAPKADEGASNASVSRANPDASEYMGSARRLNGAACQEILAGRAIKSRASDRKWFETPYKSGVRKILSWGRARMETGSDQNLAGRAQNAGRRLCETDECLTSFLVSAIVVHVCSIVVHRRCISNSPHPRGLTRRAVLLIGRASLTSRRSERSPDRRFQQVGLVLAHRGRRPA